MKVLSIIQQYFYYQQKIKLDTEKLKYYKIIDDKQKINEIIDEILDAKEEIKKILNIVI